jgi:hypothetical protein
MMQLHHEQQIYGKYRDYQRHSSLQMQLLNEPILQVHPMLDLLPMICDPLTSEEDQQRPSDSKTDIPLVLLIDQ